MATTSRQNELLGILMNKPHTTGELAALQAEARRAAANADECGADICAVEAQRQALVKQANDRAEAVTQELAATQAERRKESAQAAALAANLGLLTSLDQE